MVIYVGFVRSKSQISNFWRQWTLFSRMICWKLNMLAGWDKFKTTPTIWQILRYFSSLKYLDKFSGSVAAHYAGGEVGKMGCPVELLCITAETIYYRNAPSIFRVSCEIQGWIPMTFCLNSSGKYKFEVFEVAVLLLWDITRIPYHLTTKFIRPIEKGSNTRPDNPYTAT